MKRLIVFLVIILFVPIFVQGAGVGDVYSDNVVDTRDTISLVKHLLNIKKLTGNNLKNADTNGDGAVNTLDYITIIKLMLQGAKKFPELVVNKGTCYVILGAKVDSKIELASKAYSWDGKKTWTDSRSYKVEKKGTYVAYVKDKKGNIYASDKLTINDLNPPTNLKTKGIISSYDFGIVKGNVTEQQAIANVDNFNRALQCAHNSGITNLKVEKGIYYFGVRTIFDIYFNEEKNQTDSRINNDKTKTIKIDFSDINLDLNGSTFNVYPNHYPYYDLVYIGSKSDIHNITIKNGTLKGDRYGHKCGKGKWACVEGGYRCPGDDIPVVDRNGNAVFETNSSGKVEQKKIAFGAHEQGYGIKLRANDVRVENLNISDMTGDGILIKSYAFSKNDNYKMYIYNNVIENNRRQGITFTNGKNVVIKNNIIRNTNGKSPQAGIDFEADKATERFNNVTLDGNTFYNNFGNGVSILWGAEGYLKITNNKFANVLWGVDIYDKKERIWGTGSEQTTIYKEKLTTIVSGNTKYTGSEVRNCLCVEDLNRILVQYNYTCTIPRCRPNYCTESVTAQGTLSPGTRCEKDYCRDRADR